jgi:cell division transport system permease protein
VRALRYFVTEAWLSTVRRWRASLLSVFTIAVALFVLGAFLLVTSNLQRVIDQWGRAAEFSVYLTDTVTAEERGAIERLLSASGLAERQEYVSASVALERFERGFPELAAAAKAMPQNPLPASYEVQLRQDRARDPAVDALAARLKATAGVSDVRYDRQWVDRLLTLVGTARSLGLALAAVLALAATFTATAVVRLALFARRDEIEIMHLVGSPLAFIRGPFVLEGVIHGTIGALAAITLLWCAFLASRGTIAEATRSLFESGSLRFLPWTLLAALVLGGMLVGGLSGALAARSAR